MCTIYGVLLHTIQQGRILGTSSVFHHESSADRERRWEVFLPKRGMGVAAIGVNFPVIVQ